MARFVITGATGYLGSRILEDSLRQGHEVRVLLRPSSDPWRLKVVSHGLPHFEVYTLDGVAGIKAALAGMGATDTVIHCATSYGRKGESRAQIYRSNLLFPTELLTLAIEAGVGRFVNTDTVLSGKASLYAESKEAFRNKTRAMARAGEICVTNLALEHFYGPGDDPTKFPTWVARQCLANVTDLDLTEGTQFRDFVYIDDIVSAYRALLVKPPVSGWMSWRVGSGSTGTVREFVEMIHKLCQSSTSLNFGKVALSNQESCERTLPNLSESDLGWTPQWSLREGLQVLIDSERERMR